MILVPAQVDSFVVDVIGRPDGAELAGPLVARVVVVTTTDPRLRGHVVETRRVETLPDPPTMRLLRTLKPAEDAVGGRRGSGEY